MCVCEVTCGVCEVMCGVCEVTCGVCEVSVWHYLKKVWWSTQLFHSTLQLATEGILNPILSFTHDLCTVVGLQNQGAKNHHEPSISKLAQ